MGVGIGGGVVSTLVLYAPVWAFHGGKGLTGVDLNHLGLNKHTGPRELLRNLSNSSKEGRGSLYPLFRGCSMPFHLVSCLAGTWGLDYP